MSMRIVGLWLLLLCLVSASTLAADFDQALQPLTKSNMGAKERAIAALADSGDERVDALFKAILSGDLHYRRSDRQLVIATREGDVYRLVNPFSGESLGEAGRREVSRVVVNNGIRSDVRTRLAAMQLASPRLDVRRAAARQLLSEADPDMRPLLAERRQQEEDRLTLHLLTLTAALLDLRSADVEVREVALERLGTSLQPEVRQALVKAAANEPDERLRARAQQAVADIDDLLKTNKVLENVYYGISLGSVLLLAAIGLAITFGVMGVINMAHGEMIMLGAYTTYVVQLLMPNHLNYSLLVSVPAAFLVAGLVGVAIERGVIRHLYGRPLETLLATFGISLILQQAVRSIFSPLNRQVITPDWMSGSFEINGALALTYNRFYIIFFSLTVLAILILVLRKTHFGLQMRAVTQNRRMASAMGIRTGWVDAMTFGLGSGIAGIAGVALSQLTNVGPNMGQQYIIDSFLVVVFGGVGNLLGTFVGAMSLGIGNKLIEPWTGAVLAKIVILVAVILFIQKRPRGLFALKGRAIED